MQEKKPMSEPVNEAVDKINWLVEGWPPSVVSALRELIAEIMSLGAERDRLAAKHAQLLEGLENLGWPCRLEELPEYTRTLSAKLAESEAERDRERKAAEHATRSWEWAMAERNGIISRLRLHFPHIKTVVFGDDPRDPGPPTCMRCKMEDRVIGQPWHDGLGPSRPRGE